MTAIAAAAGVNGSNAAPLRSIETFEEKPLPAAAFSCSRARADGRENPAGLLDIAGSLC
jgi:hypothetical protein